MWHVTCDTRQVICDMWRVIYMVSKFQVPSSNGLRDIRFCRYFHKPSVISPASDGGVCRTAPATPGLLSIWNTALAEEGIPLWYFWQEIYLHGLGWNGIDVCFILESAFLVLNFFFLSILLKNHFFFICLTWVKLTTLVVALHRAGSRGQGEIHCSPPQWQ